MKKRGRKHSHGIVTQGLRGNRMLIIFNQTYSRRIENVTNVSLRVTKLGRAFEIADGYVKGCIKTAFFKDEFGVTTKIV